MDNILFIGNGFDLHNGMKTSYTNYLDSLKIPKDYVSNIINLIEIHSFFNILSSVEINIITDDKTSSRYNQRNDCITIYNYHIRKYPQIESNYGKYFIQIKENYDILKKENPNNKIHFVDFYNINKCNIFYLIRLTYDSKAPNYVDFLESIIYCKGEIFKKLNTKLNSPEYIPINYTKYSDLLNKLSLYTESYDYFSLYLELIRNYPKDTINNPITNINELAIGENWIDLENILYYNQFPHFQSNISNNEDKFEYTTETLFMYRNFIKLFDTDVTIDTDFESFKENFSKYVTTQQKIIEDNKPSVDKLLTNINNEFKLNKVYNFNYSNYTNAIFKEIDKNILIDNIHGSVDDGKNIVFGSNHYLFLNDLTSYNELLTKHNKEEYISQKESHYKLTKFYQVLKLSQIRKTRRLYHVNSLTILGHSIGNQDFEYFHTIINSNPQEIKLNIIWSSFEDKEGNPVNNLEPLTDAVYEMLESYKDLYQDITVHRMILENRIKFIHLDDFIEESTK